MLGSGLLHDGGQLDLPPFLCNILGTCDVGNELVAGDVLGVGLVLIVVVLVQFHLLLELGSPPRHVLLVILQLALSQSCFFESFGICKPLNFRELIF